MHQITRSCVLVLWIQTVALVQSQECTLQEYLNSPQFDPNLNTTSLKASYPDGGEVKVGCNNDYPGFVRLLCKQGEWTALAKCQNCTLQDYLNGPQIDPNLNATSMKIRNPKGGQVRASCNEGYGGLRFLACFQGLWFSVGRCQQCTLQEYLNGTLFDPNLNTTSLKASYPSDGSVSVSCNEGYAGIVHLTCYDGRWFSSRQCQHPSAFTDPNNED